MKILVINAGSSSIKYQLIDMKTEKAIAKGLAERIGGDGSVLKQKTADDRAVTIEQPMPTHKEAMQFVLQALMDKENGVIKKVSDIAAVGHRMLHSAEDFHGSIMATAENIATCRKNSDLGPLHMPPMLDCLDSCREVMKDTPMTIVFDTTFHSTMEPVAYLYGVPYELYEKYKVRRYGFHGTSHKFVSEEAAKIVGGKSKIIVCHLGNGSSISAVKNGKCVDTSMGFTPLEGLMMGTRSGDIDPAAVDYIASKLNYTLPQMVQYLNKKSGMLGISGFSADCRDLTEAAEKGNERARLAIEMTAYRIKKYVGSYAAALGGVDLIAFTGGIGENSAIIRGLVMEGTEYMGVDFDFAKNKVRTPGVTELSKPGSRVKVYIIPTNEELSIARETAQLLKA
ncbi:MAG: acetate kinase [Clostridiaceae bacterium]|jgi:acetate kinase|nr:acetate kinase [Clostridiaceae bacterium]